MNKNTIGIASATIKGLDKKPYYFDEKCFWAWNIRFDNAPLFAFNNLCFIYMGETEEEANKSYQEFKGSFTDNHIFEEDTVAIIYDKDGIVAIGKDCQDCWIHVRDKYKAKTFKELNLSFDSLVVNCNY